MNKLWPWLLLLFRLLLILKLFLMWYWHITGVRHWMLSMRSSFSCCAVTNIPFISENGYFACSLMRAVSWTFVWTCMYLISICNMMIKWPISLSGGMHPSSWYMEWLQSSVTHVFIYQIKSVNQVCGHLKLSGSWQKAEKQFHWAFKERKSLLSLIKKKKNQTQSSKARRWSISSSATFLVG